MGCGRNTIPIYGKLVSEKVYRLLFSLIALHILVGVHFLTYSFLYYTTRCYDQPTIYGFAKHWETQEPMPLSMFEKLKEQKTYNAGMMSCRQLLFGQLDLELHSNYNPNPDNAVKESIFDAHRKMAEIYTPYNLPLVEDRFLCSFAHIFAGGYAAGYYSYKWAEVMSSDAFGAFEDVGLDNEDAIQNVGMKFRNTILSLGGSLDPMTVFTNFRGREPNPEALLRHNGLLVTTK
jgi:oligopeptidase A